MSFLCVEILMVYLSSFELCKSLLLKPFIILRYSFFKHFVYTKDVFPVVKNFITLFMIHPV